MKTAQDGSKLCKCEWKERLDKSIPIASWVPMDSIRLCDPYVLISYIEFVGRIYGTENEPESYPLYFANPNLCDASFPINSEETLNFDIEKS